MATLLYSAMISLDGFIAGAGGDMSWLSAYVGPDRPASEQDSGLDIDELMANIGALLIGHRTFTGDDPNKGTDAEGAFGGKWHGPSIVLTHEPPPEQDPDPEVRFASDLESAVELSKDAAGDRYVN